MNSSFRHLTLEQRHEFLRQRYFLTAEEIQSLSGSAVSSKIAEHLIENAVGYFQIPLGIATHFRVDGNDRLIPMAVEETSIIAAASATAKWVCSQGSLTTRMRGKWIIGQVQLPEVRDPNRARALLEPEIPHLIEAANQVLPGLVDRGGGVQRITIRELEGVPADQEAVHAAPRAPMLVLHLLCDPCDAMGANLINQVCEALKPRIEAITGEKVGLCILSNLVDGKVAIAEAEIPGIDPELGRGIEEATRFAKVDPYRAATHNKGVLNGIDPILIATGNDWRAVEAGIHAYAARTGRYQPITDWWMEGDCLRGRIEVPMAVGTVGGVTRIHPTAQVALKILGVTGAEDLARICAAVGLIQNLGALKALSTVGIVRGHMELHAANLALAAGSNHDEVAEVRTRLTEMLKDKKRIGISVAREILSEIRMRGDTPVEMGSGAR